MPIVYLALGSNEGDSIKLVAAAMSLIEERIGRIIAQSQMYETEPVGFVSSLLFINAAVSVETLFAPYEILSITQGIERELGRTNKSIDQVYSDRSIDIDICLYGEAVITSPELTIPHPRMHERAFVLAPLCDIAPELRHPTLDVTLRELLDACSDAENCLLRNARL